MSEADYFTDPDSGVLKNRLGIRNRDSLEAHERRIAQERAVQGIKDFEVSYRGFKRIHQHLFGDLYEWAGKSRGEEVTIGGKLFYPNLNEIATKGQTAFAPTNFIESQTPKYFEQVKSKLDASQSAGHLTIERFADIAARHIGDINHSHPFREGNGRTMRVYLEHLAEEYGFSLPAQKFAKARWMEGSHKAMEESYDPLKRLFLEHLTLLREGEQQREGRGGGDTNNRENEQNRSYKNISVSEAGRQLAQKMDLEYRDLSLERDMKARYAGFIKLHTGIYAAIVHDSELALVRVEHEPKLERGAILSLSLGEREGMIRIRQEQQQAQVQSKGRGKNRDQEMEL